MKSEKTACVVRLTVQEIHYLCSELVASMRSELPIRSSQWEDWAIVELWRVKRDSFVEDSMIQNNSGDRAFWERMVEDFDYDSALFDKLRDALPASALTGASSN